MIDLNQYKGAFPWVDEIIKELEESRSAYEKVCLDKQSNDEDYIKKTIELQDLRLRNEKLVDLSRKIEGAAELLRLQHDFERNRNGIIIKLLKDTHYCELRERGKGDCEVCRIIKNIEAE